jgi:hypothetical protein
MHKAFLTLVVIIGVSLLPTAVIAHGGVEKTTGKTSVYITQTPISPFVGEVVQFTFVLKQGINAPLRNLPVKLTLIDTYYGDESKDTVVLTERKQTDANGAFQFSYTFSKENYFDIDLAFIDPTDNTEQEVGFLIQPRTLNIIQNKKTINIIIAGAAGLVLGMLSQRLIHGPKTTPKST